MTKRLSRTNAEYRIQVYDPARYQVKVMMVASANIVAGLTLIGVAALSLTLVDALVALWAAVTIGVGIGGAFGVAQYNALHADFMARKYGVDYVAGETAEPIEERAIVVSTPRGSTAVTIGPKRLNDYQFSAENMRDFRARCLADGKVVRATAGFSGTRWPDVLTTLKEAGYIDDEQNWTERGRMWLEVPSSSSSSAGQTENRPAAREGGGD